ncbi:unnamed protein product, partial [Meganyctiphanes norvegica]
MTSAMLKNHVNSIFKMHGLAIRSDASKYLCELLEPLPKNEHDEWIDKVVEEVQKLPINSTVISKDIIHKAAQEVSANEDDDLEGLLQVMDIYKTPQLTYSIERRKFVLAPPTSRSLHGDANDKAALFRDRYTTVYQRTCNHEFFRPPSIGSVDDGSKKYTLQKVEFLLGLSSRENEVVVLGLLTQLTEGQYHLEDDTGAVTLDLKETKFHTGLFVQNCYVLVEGWYEDGVLHALAMGLPPPEAPNSTRALLGNINYFGGPDTDCAKNNVKLQTAERENKDAMIVFLSDLWLDRIKVLEKLRLLFAGYSQFPPVAFIFCGNFLSVSHGPQQYPEPIDRRHDFGDFNMLFIKFRINLIKKFLMEGLKGFCASCMLPRPPLPKLVTEDFKKKIQSAEFVSNPVRILYCTQEIVVFREDIVAKMCRNCVYFPTNSDDIPSHFAKTIVSQASLSPLPLHVLPIYWGMDHCMALHPTPDLIITADKGDPFITQDNNATVVNPGA